MIQKTNRLLENRTPVEYARKPGVTIGTNKKEEVLKIVHAQK